jgi:hypothetical protein
MQGAFPNWAPPSRYPVLDHAGDKAKSTLEAVRIAAKSAARAIFCGPACRPGHVLSCIDQSYVRKRLREVTQQPSGHRVVAFREQADVVPYAQELLE